MSLEAAFVTPLFVEKLPTIDNDHLAKVSYDLKANSKGRVVSNYGGWQSEGFDEPHPDMLELVDIITDKLNQFHVDIGLSDRYVQRISNMWVNINGPQDFNHAHDHPGATFSGVYYVKCKPTSGKIVFMNPRASHLHDEVISEYTPAVASRYFHVPEESKLVMFPGYLNHFVEPNESGEDRISISFNSVIYRLD